MYSLSVAYGTPQTSSISDRQQVQEQVLEVAMPGKLPTPFLTWGLQQHSNHRYSQEPQKLNPLSTCLAAWSALHVLLLQQDREVSIKGGLQDLLFGLQAALGAHPVLLQ
jgi:predicted lipid carrier protein YhbT